MCCGLVLQTGIYIFSQFPFVFLTQIFKIRMRWRICTALRKTSGIFCTSCYLMKCAPACLLCAAGLPLPMASYAGRCRGHTYISCHFGEVDAFGNAGHRGTDIPAPEGTPILAAHSETVLVSGWNDSYGNQVLLDNGSGLSTRYAHMTQTAVTAGEAVTAGQVIGYVGSTGDTTCILR